MVGNSHQPLYRVCLFFWIPVQKQKCMQQYKRYVRDCSQKRSHPQSECRDLLLLSALVPLASVPTPCRTVSFPERTLYVIVVWCFSVARLQGILCFAAEIRLSTRFTTIPHLKGFAVPLFLTCITLVHQQCFDLPSCTALNLQESIFSQRCWSLMPAPLRDCSGLFPLRTEEAHHHDPLRPAWRWFSPPRSSPSPLPARMITLTLPFSAQFRPAEGSCPSFRPSPGTNNAHTTFTNPSS